jgi:hypothetical protein
MTATLASNRAVMQQNSAAHCAASAQRSRNLQSHGLDEGASLRMLIHTGRVVRAGLPLEAAVQSGIVLPITDNPDIRAALSDIGPFEVDGSRDAEAAACAARALRHLK